MILGHVGLEEGLSDELNFNGDKDRKEEEEYELAKTDGQEATACRRLVARVYFHSRDSPDLQYPAKEFIREMKSPTVVGSWKRLKKVAKFLVRGRCVV